MNVKLDAIEHPAHPEWSYHPDWYLFEAGLIEKLKQRFSHTDVDLQALHQRIKDETNVIEQKRIDAEAQNFNLLIGKIGHNGTHGLNFNDALRYYALAGQENLVGEYIHFFGMKAVEAYHVDGTARHETKITLELAGKKQYGDWNAAAGVDRFAEAAAEQVPYEMPNAKFTLLDMDDPANRSATFRPLFNNPQRPQEGFDYGVVRRRRRVANIFKQTGLKIELFKESFGLVIPDFALKDDRLALMTAMRPGWQDVGMDATSQVAIVAGDMFHRASKEQDMKTLDVSPMAAQLLMVARNPYLRDI